MISVARALSWAIAMILIAVGEAYGLVDRNTASTMFAILPGLAVATSLRRNRACFRRAGAAQ
ncbi:MAG TPA: hypothetical protein VGE65_06880 [Sphingobium sp.]